MSEASLADRSGQASSAAVPEWCAIFPPWRWRLRPARVASTLTGMIGSSLVAVFRKDAEP